MKSASVQQAKEVIKTLSDNNFYCTCPCGCGEEIKLKDCDLFYLDNFSPAGKAAYEELLQNLKEQRVELKERESNMNTRPEIAAKATNIGFILERIAPAFDHFPFDRSDCRSLFDPIDYVIFEGLNNSGVVRRIILSDIKTGAARLSHGQKAIKGLIERKKIEYKTY